MMSMASGCPRNFRYDVNGEWVSSYSLVLACLNKGKTWADVRRELSNEQIVDIYNLYWSLWQIETDFFRLLPRPDNHLRAVYTGMLDPRTIAIPLATTPFFDQIIIQHPFVHPKAVNSEFSPLENPHKHKYQTLKNLLLFITLEPFVRSGQVSFIPDPCMFDNFLHREVMSMAEARRGDQPIHEAEKKRMMKLSEDDFFRTWRGQTKEQLKHQLSRSDQNLSDEEIDELFWHMKKLNDNDQLALLQDDLFENGGQLMMSNMAPNFEMALFIAQITGSLVVTDSETRWDEFVSAQATDRGIASHLMNPLTEVTNSSTYILNTNPNHNLDQEVWSKFGGVRKLFREVFVQANEKQGEPSAPLLDKYKTDFDRGFQKANEAYNNQDEGLFKARLKLLIPQGGLTHNNVQRLLIKSGNSGLGKNVPMGILIEPTEW